MLNAGHIDVGLFRVGREGILAMEGSSFAADIYVCAG